MTPRPAHWPLLAGINGAMALGLAVFAVALWAQTGALVGAFVDDGFYVTLAQSLAEGHGYRNLNLPGAPPHVRYPFLYPAALSLLWRLWPQFPANVALVQLFDSAAAVWAQRRQGCRQRGPTG